MDVDLFLVGLLILAGLQCAGSLLLLALLGIGYVVVYAIRHGRQALLAYTRFLSWTFGTREARRHRIAVYAWFIGTMVMYVADLAGAEPGFPRTGNLLCLVMFPIAAFAVYLDYYTYFRKDSSKPA